MFYLLVHVTLMERVFIEIRVSISVVSWILITDYSCWDHLQSGNEEGRGDKQHLWYCSCTVQNVRLIVDCTVVRALRQTLSTLKHCQPRKNRSYDTFKLWLKSQSVLQSHVDQSCSVDPSLIKSWQHSRSWAPDRLELSHWEAIRGCWGMWSWSI